jgi:adenosine deaminase
VNDAFALRLPKAELHVHIEGTFEPDLIFALAERNRIALPYASVDALRAAYEFSNLQSFLNLYYAAMSVLRTEADFVELANEYLARAQSQGLVHAEIFFDPQAHTGRGVPFRTVIDGLWSAVQTSVERYGVTTKLIMCFLRDAGPEAALATLAEALPFGDRIVAVGLDSAEAGYPPSLFAEVFARARAAGWRAVAHAGEEGPPAYVWQALDLLRVSRIDHGVRSLEDPKLVARLRDERIPLTVCPLSNVKLRVVDTLADHPLGRMLDAGLLATVNSDDPAYFGGYVGENYLAVQAALGLPPATLVTLARNSFEASFLSAEERAAYLARVDVIAGGARAR